MPPNVRLFAAFPRKNSPSKAHPQAFPRKNSPSKPYNAVFRPFFLRRANFFALTPMSGRAGRTFSRRNCSTHGEMKPSTPMRGPQCACVKPATPLLAKIAPKTCVSASQDRGRHRLGRGRGGDLLARVSRRVPGSAYLGLTRARLLYVPVGGGPPARRPRRELRSARRLEARPGPATAHGHRSQALRTLGALRRPPHRRRWLC